jgi:hypothetical protein
VLVTLAWSVFFFLCGGLRARSKPLLFLLLLESGAAAEHAPEERAPATPSAQ